MSHNSKKRGSSNFISRNRYFKQSKINNSRTFMPTHGYFSIMYNSQDVNTTQIFNNRLLNNDPVVYTHWNTMQFYLQFIEA